MSAESALVVAVDAMGGDHGPRITVPACVRALSFQPDISFVLLGDEAEIAACLQRESLTDAQRSRIQVEPTEQVIGMGDKPAHALRNKKKSSLYRAVELLRDGRVSACVSAGNTGALLAIGCHVLQPFPGIDRPAICTVIPTQTSRCFLLDIGANIHVHAENLHQFALMGSVLASAVLGIERPRVGLLNVGVEDIKGNEQVRVASSLLQEDEDIHYIGFVEADQLFFDAADVIVCDGFVGNVALKASEGVARYINQKIRALFTSSWSARLLGWLLKPLLKPLRAELDPRRYNGASFLGLPATLVKSHGNADVDAFCQAIELACVEARAGIPQRISEKLEYLL